jgi:hypothetical protein
MTRLNQLPVSPRAPQPLLKEIIVDLKSIRDRAFAMRPKLTESKREELDDEVTHHSAITPVSFM